MNITEYSLPRYRTDYRIRSVVSQQLLDDTDDNILLYDPEVREDGLLRSEYPEVRFAPGGAELGLFRFAQWLPVRRMLAPAPAPIAYRSEGLGTYLGLRDLWVTFSGYWPERHAGMESGTFKECEANAVCARLVDNKKIMVLASAGNTARAFMRVCERSNIPAVIVIPLANMSALWASNVSPSNSCVKVIALSGNADYADAIEVAERIAQMDGFFSEGGVRNIARRDGMGTTVLAAVAESGRVPDCYIQAVGSGTGAIAAWEAWIRLSADPQFGRSRPMKIIAVQNRPCQWIYNAWKSRNRFVDIPADSVAKRQIARIKAKVLSNRRPAYTMAGGLYDALSDTNGDMYAVSNRKLKRAARLFEQYEKIDITPEGAVAAAALIEARQEGQIDENDMVMLNITGGGIARYFKEHRHLIAQRSPDHILRPEQRNADALHEIVSRMCAI